MLKYLFITLFIFILSPVLGQERTTMDILISYKWNISAVELAKEKDPDFPDEPYPIEDYMIFTETTYTNYEKWSDEPNKLESYTKRFYIGIEGVDVKINNPNNDFYDRYAPVTFNTAKVGQNKNGGYILFEHGRNGEAAIHKIIEITDKKLILQLVNPETIGSGKTTEWEAQPKN